MSSQAEASANKMLKHNVTKLDAAEVVGMKEILEGLVKSARSLVLHPSIDGILERFEDIQKLEDDNKLKDGVINRLNQELEKEIADHAKTHEKSLATYDAAREKLRSELQTTQDEIAKSRQKIEGLNSRLQEMTKDNAQLTDHSKKLQGQLKSRSDEIKSLKGQVKQLEESARTQQMQTDKLEEDLNDRDNRLSRSQEELEDLEKAYERLRKKEQHVTGQLDAISRLFVDLTNQVPENSMRDLDELWETACNLVNKTFCEDLPANILQNKQAWEGLKNPFYWEHSLPIPQSNSISAKHMRAVVVLTSLARTCEAQIFQPTYLLPRDSGVRDLLTRQALKEPPKEALFRAILQALLPEEHEAALCRRVDQTCDHLHKLVDALLPPERLSTFKNELRSIVEDTAYIWQEVLKSTYAVEACFDLETYSNWSWHHLEYEEASIRISRDVRQPRDEDRPLFAVFPRMFISDDDGRDPETHGVLFMKSQTAAAMEELEYQSPVPELQRADSVLAKRHRPRRTSGSWPRRGDSTSFLDQGPGNESSGGTRGD